MSASEKPAFTAWSRPTNPHCRTARRPARSSNSSCLHGWRDRQARTLDGGTDQVAPLGPRAVVVADVVEAEQVGQDEPGVARALADAAVGDDVVVGRQALLLLVDLTELVGRLEAAVLVRRPLPRDAGGSGDVAAAQGSLLRVLGHVQLGAGVLLRGTHVDEGLARPDVGVDVVPEGPDLLVAA